MAGTAAAPDGTAAPAWNAGDLLVLVGDSFNARVIVYTETNINEVIKTSRSLGAVQGQERVAARHGHLAAGCDDKRGQP
ncbi:MAG TPA: hypothetical protein VII35_16100, partial [Steroidobacteraceae bacterium]